MYIFVHTPPPPPCVFDLLHTSHLLNSTIALYWDLGQFLIHPLKMNMEHNRGGLEDHFPVYMGDW